MPKAATATARKTANKTAAKPAKKPAGAKSASSTPATPPTPAAVLAELRRLGTAQNVKIFRRHGAVDPLFGVSSANIDAIAKRIGRDHALAAALWQSGNFDAMYLASKVAQPEALDARALQDWVKAVNSYPISMSFGVIAASTPAAVTCLPGWTGARQEYIRAAGYDTISAMLREGVDLPDGFLSGVIDTIERELHASPNRARHSMNSALISIGGYRTSLRSRAVAAAKRIGKVEVDHGQTSCKTPDAVGYIAKIAARQKG